MPRDLSLSVALTIARLLAGVAFLAATASVVRAQATPPVRDHVSTPSSLMRAEAAMFRDRSADPPPLKDLTGPAFRADVL